MVEGVAHDLEPCRPWEGFGFSEYDGNYCKNLSREETQLDLRFNRLILAAMLRIYSRLAVVEGERLFKRLL